MFQILQSFHINITLSYKALPFIKVYPLFLDEGSQKTITEFEIDIYDRDSIVSISLFYYINIYFNSLKNFDFVYVLMCMYVGRGIQTFETLLCFTGFCLLYFRKTYIIF